VPINKAYSEYLRSPEWRKLRRAVLERENHKCQRCKEKATHVHHLHYGHIFHEELDDLEALCVDCHRKVHGKRRKKKKNKYKHRTKEKEIKYHYKNPTKKWKCPKCDKYFSRGTLDRHYALKHVLKEKK